MKFLYSFCGLLRSFLFISLLAGVLTSAHLDISSRDLQSNRFRRSLPASLATAPQGAVGYQPPPGPIANPYVPDVTSAPSDADTAAATPEDTVMPELKREPYDDSTGDNDCLSRSQKNIDAITGVQAVKVAAHQAMANRGMVWSSGGFSLTFALCMLLF
ncbi:hypothetical protein BO71DRAFT_442537 [Aspergillus ellipticus CBS 707.79]|uniref:Uncharacterized protein n=1 Tax=Aspergillus ellipticus CBS 707.79 TaxID=1448320 RepID=A0A319EN28_9EURO|nr:hypothetical protein BO71DRAFT_442537 [Aspergillus ellipticus CBS 707.79]